MNSSTNMERSAQEDRNLGDQISNGIKFLEGGGTMGALMRSFDWSKTVLGSPSDWSQSLKTSVSICLNSRFAILIWWGEDLIKLYNDAYTLVLGKKHPGALGAAGKDVWPEIWHIIGPMLEGVLERGEATWADDLLLELERDGYAEECYFTFSYSPIRDESGKVVGVFTPVQETTGKVIGERRLRTLRHLSDAARASNAQNTTEVCTAAARVLAQNPQDIPFAALYSIEHDKAVLICSAGIDEPCSLFPSVIECEADSDGWGLAQALNCVGPEVLKIPDGFEGLPRGAWPLPPNEMILLPISSAGQKTGFMIAGVSPRKRLDADYISFMSLVVRQITTAIADVNTLQQERRRAEALVEIDRAKTTFFSNVSHEFRTPLTLMLGPLEETLALGNLLPDRAQQSLTIVHRNSMRLLRLVNSLLDFSRIEAGRMRASYEPTDLSSLTAELVSNFRSATDHAGLALFVECPPLPEPVYVDREMWEKIVLNLVSNAFKFTFQGYIKVQIEALDDRVELSVKDSGIGIAEHELPHLFERFHRVEGAKGRTIEGTGIGLALVQELVRMQDGVIRVTSEVGNGTTFTVSIPLHKSRLLRARTGEMPSPASTTTRTDAFVDEALQWLPEHAGVFGTAKRPRDNDGDAIRKFKRKSETVLIVDDNGDMRDYLRSILDENFHVIAAVNGEEAIKAARLNPVDLVLSDIMMPGLDGYGLIRCLRSDPHTQTIPVILLSARAGEEARNDGMAGGADDYLIKPFAARELLARVEAHLSLARMRHEAAEARRLSEVASTERLNRVFQQAPVAIIVFRGKDFVVELANPFYHALLPGREIVGRRFAEVVPELQQEVWDVFNRVIETGQPYMADEWLIPFDSDQDGVLEDHWFNVVYHPLREVNETVSGFIAVLTDVTAQVQARREVERVNKDLEEFAYVASHDLQEPLRMVNIYTELLMKRYVPDEPEAKHYAEFVKQGVVRMETLIRDLLTYSQTVQRGESLVGQADLSAALGEAMAVLHTHIDENGAAIHSESLPTVRGDTKLLAHVFQNLLSNALKYRKKELEPQISIAAKRDGENWLISLKDNGIGFEQQYAERIFGLFKRLHQSEYPGTGLGLAICQRIVERYGGRMWAESRLGEGATFFFTIPAVEEKADRLPPG